MPAIVPHMPLVPLAPWLLPGRQYSDAGPAVGQGKEDDRSHTVGKLLSDPRLSGLHDVSGASLQMRRTCLPGHLIQSEGGLAYLFFLISA